MSYYINKTIQTDTFEQAVEKVTAVLADVGFGILTTIDMQATLKKKVNKDIGPYTILGACNAGFANQALQKEPHVGVYLPCNVVVKQGQGGFEVAAVDPVASMQSVPNQELLSFAADVKQLLQNAIDKL